MVETNSSNSRLGRFVESPVAGEIVRAFVPPPLPPDPPIDMLALLDRLSVAERALGRLDGITVLLPRQELFLYMYVRKEAVLSSQIEGTQSTLADLLRFETEAQAGQPIDDIREVSNYVAATMHGLERLETLPLSLRLIREMHARLLQGGRGGSKNPGEFRRSQNWIGGTRPGNALFVPPPADEVAPSMAALEKYLHSDAPAVIKAGLAHAQFESIHPFLDGNGRLGRLLITFVLCVEGALSQPLLHLSLYLKAHRSAYYEALQRVRMEGDWEGWLKFYFEGIEQASREGAETIRKLLKMFDEHRDRIQGLGRGAGSALQLHDLLKKQVYASLPKAAAEIRVSYPTV